MSVRGNQPEPGMPSMLSGIGAVFRYDSNKRIIYCGSAEGIKTLKSNGLNYLLEFICWQVLLATMQSSADC